MEREEPNKKQLEEIYKILSEQKVEIIRVKQETWMIAKRALGEIKQAEELIGEIEVQQQKVETKLFGAKLTEELG